MKDGAYLKVNEEVQEEVNEEVQEEVNEDVQEEVHVQVVEEVNEQVLEVEVEVQMGGDGLSECEVQSHLRNHLPQVKETDVRGEEGVQDEVEGLVDVQISLDNGDHNLFEGSVEVQCQVHNEQESDQVEHTEKEKVRKRNIATSENPV
ncbi:hypothetical protein DEO72_LG3g324 [Vigna unguiculata]|uniref:Uncharacterized protein n=1 Tax=Vigna unguiculata TaxID=3917 RepID=A0A4D6LBD2_VIGUN|nr:hypothetical protein DEO72_LG3g324 [Vigna unguiculata]